jgi:hypothetical protein
VAVPRATGILKIDKMLQSPHLQSNPTKDLWGCNIKFVNTDFVGGMKLEAVWQRRSVIDFDRCKFRLSPVVHNPTNGTFDIVLKDGTVYRSIDMISTSFNQWSRLADFTGLANVQASADAAITVNNRVSCVELGLDADSYSHNWRFTDCEFYIDQDKGIGIKVAQTNAADDASPSIIRMIRPRFIDQGGGTSAAISAWYSAGVGGATIVMEDEVNGASTLNQAHTSNPSITVT